MTVFWILLLAHLLLTAVFCVLAWRGVLCIPYSALLTVLFVPPVGYLAALAAHLAAVQTGQTGRTPGLERLTVNNEMYKSVFVGDNSTDRDTVPLQEALLLNDSGTKRRLMMDVLNSGTEQYVALLGTARNDKDTEVSHYAATAMAELMKERELGVQRFEQQLARAPDDENTLREYRNYLADYLGMGLLEGALLTMYRYTYLRLLDREEAATGPQPPLCAARLDTQIALGNYSEAAATAAFALQRWPDDAAAYLMQLKLYHALKNPAGIRDTLAAVRARGIYLSAAQRETLDFWGSTETTNQSEFE